LHPQVFEFAPPPSGGVSKNLLCCAPPFFFPPPTTFSLPLPSCVWSFPTAGEESPHSFFKTHGFEVKGLRFSSIGPLPRTHTGYCGSVVSLPLYCFKTCVSVVFFVPLSPHRASLISHIHAKSVIPFSGMVTKYKWQPLPFSYLSSVTSPPSQKRDDPFFHRTRSARAGWPIVVPRFLSMPIVLNNT